MIRTPVNRKELSKKIKDSGYKQEYVARMCSMSRFAWHHKMSGESDFRIGEIKMISSLLKLSPEEREKIFGI